MRDTSYTLVVTFTLLSHVQGTFVRCLENLSFWAIDWLVQSRRSPQEEQVIYVSHFPHGVRSATVTSDDHDILIRRMHKQFAFGFDLLRLAFCLRSTLGLWSA